MFSFRGTPKPGVLPLDPARCFTPLGAYKLAVRSRRVSPPPCATAYGLFETIRRQCFHDGCGPTDGIAIASCGKKINNNTVCEYKFLRSLHIVQRFRYKFGHICKTVYSTQVSSTENYGRRCQPLSPHHFMIYQ